MPNSTLTQHLPVASKPEDSGLGNHKSTLFDQTERDQGSRVEGARNDALAKSEVQQPGLYQSNAAHWSRQNAGATGQLGPAPSDEIDLIEVIRALWGLRFYIAVSACVGALASVTVLPKVVPSTYSANIPIAIDYASLPAISNDEEVVKKLNAALGTEFADLAFSKAFIAKFPEWQPASAEKPSTDVKADQSSKSGVVIFGGRFASSEKELPIQLKNNAGSSQFILQVKLPSRTTRTTDIKPAALEALNAVVAEANADAKKMHESLTGAVLENARELNRASQDALAQSKEIQHAIMETAGKIQSIEYFLSQKISLLSKAGRSFLESSERNDKDAKEEKPFVSVPAHTLLYKQSAERISRALMLAGLLHDEKLLSDKDLNESRAKLLELQAQLDQSYSERQTLEKLSESSVASLADSMKKRNEPIDKAKTFLPHFRVDVASGRFDTVALAASPGPKTIVLAAVFVSALLGLALGFCFKILPQLLRQRQQPF